MITWRETSLFLFPYNCARFSGTKTNEGEKGVSMSYKYKALHSQFSTLSLKNVNHDGPHDAILLVRSAPSILENMMASNSITTCTYFTAHWTSRCTIVTKPCSLRTLDVYSFIAFMVHQEESNKYAYMDFLLTTYTVSRFDYSS